MKDLKSSAGIFEDFIQHFFQQCSPLIFLLQSLGISLFLVIAARLHLLCNYQNEKNAFVYFKNVNKKNMAANSSFILGETGSNDSRWVWRAHWGTPSQGDLPPLQHRVHTFTSTMPEGTQSRCPPNNPAVCWPQRWHAVFWSIASIIEWRYWLKYTFWYRHVFHQSWVDVEEDSQALGKAWALEVYTLYSGMSKETLCYLTANQSPGCGQTEPPGVQKSVDNIVTWQLEWYVVTSFSFICFFFLPPSSDWSTLYTYNSLRELWVMHMYFIQKPHLWLTLRTVSIMAPRHDQPSGNVTSPRS